MSDLSTTLEDRHLAMRILSDATVLTQRIVGAREDFDDPVVQKPSSLITLDDYQKSMLITANRKLTWRDQLINVMGGLGEAGEVQGNIKKYLFHESSPLFHDFGDKDLVSQHNVLVNSAFRHKTALELGDNLYYVAWGAWLLGYTLADIGFMNRSKLIERYGK
jgi:hypothetical protein